MVFYREEITESKPWKSFLNSVNGMIAGSQENDKEGDLNQGGIVSPTLRATTSEISVNPTVIPSVVTETLSFNDESDISKAITEYSSTDLGTPTTADDGGTVVPSLVNTDFKVVFFSMILVPLIFAIYLKFCITTTTEAEKGGFFGLGIFDDLDTGSGATTEYSTPVVNDSTDYE